MTLKEAREIAVGLVPPDTSVCAGAEAWAYGFSEDKITTFKISILPGLNAEDCTQYTAPTMEEVIVRLKNALGISSEGQDDIECIPEEEGTE